MEEKKVEWTEKLSEIIQPTPSRGIFSQHKSTGGSTQINSRNQSQILHHQSDITINKNGIELDSEVVGEGVHH